MILFSGGEGQLKSKKSSKVQTFFLSGMTCRGKSAIAALTMTVANLTTKSVVTATQRSTHRVMRSTAGHTRYRLHTYHQPSQTIAQQYFTTYLTASL